MRLIQSILAATIVAVVVVGCAPAATPPAIPSPPSDAGAKAGPKSSEAPKPPSKSADMAASYEALVEAAKKEGKIVVSNSQVFVRDGLKEFFGKRFGIEVEYLHLSPGDLFTRLRTERQAGQYNLDVVLSGGTTFVGNMIPEKMVDPLDDVLILPEARDASKWLDGTVAWFEPEHKAIRLNKYVSNYISVNPTIVQKDEITEYKDLLNPKWKGKIAGHDPTVPGAGANAAAFLLVSLGEDFVKQLYLGQETVFSRDERQMSDWLGRGKYPILVWGSNAGVIRQIENDGLPVQVISTKDVAALESGWGVAGMINRAPHPNAARLFINWIASREGMEAWAKISGWPVTRTDVDQSSLPDYLKVKAGMKYLDMAGYEFVTTQKLKAEERLRELIKR